jgi:AraC-like DNA-binding protein
MLMETSLSVTAVAQRCGFRNLSNFNTQFRRLAGQTPQSFRQACRGLSPSL